MQRRRVAALALRAFLSGALGFTGAAAAQGLVNGNFDAGPGAPWVETGSFPIITHASALPAAISPQSGLYSAWLGGATSDFSTLTQDFSIPAGFQANALEFYSWVTTQETDPVAFDTLTIRIDTTPLLSLSNLNQGSAWVRQSLLLPSFSSGLHRLELTAVNDGTLATSFFVDTFSLTLAEAAPPPPPPAVTVSVLVNGNFDSGPGAPWVEIADFPIIVQPAASGLAVSPHSGDYVAFLGGVADDVSLLQQEFFIPDGFTAAQMSFQAWVASAETLATEVDILTLRIDSQLVLELSNLDATSAWSQHELDLSLLGLGPGAHVLEFFAANDSAQATSFFFDSLSITAQAPAQAVPEPGTYALLLAGLALLGFRRAVRGGRRIPAAPARPA